MVITRRSCFSTAVNSYFSVLSGNIRSEMSNSPGVTRNVLQRWAAFHRPGRNIRKSYNITCCERVSRCEVLRIVCQNLICAARGRRKLLSALLNTLLSPPSTQCILMAREKRKSRIVAHKKSFGRREWNVGAEQASLASERPD